MNPPLFAPPPPRPSPFVGPAAHAALASGGGTAIAAAVRAGVMDVMRFGLLATPLAKPVAFDSLQALARALHRRRGGEAIELEHRALTLPGEPRSRNFVSVYTVAESGRRRFLGHAWLGDCAHGRERLEAALYAIAPRAFVAPDLV